MWKHMARIIGEVRPKYAFVENSPMLTLRGLGVVLGDLSSMGFDAEWGVISAGDCGAPHERQRIWIVANEQSADMADSPQLQCDERNDNTGVGLESGQVPEFGNNGWAHYLADTNGERQQKFDPAGIATGARRTGRQFNEIGRADWWAVEPDIRRVVNGVAARVDRLKAIGNGQVPIVAATAFSLLLR
jgi:DNA (cytosine-5)-methyltransferase 1